MSRILLVAAPTRIHPWLERHVAGGTIETIDVHRLPRVAQVLIWKSHMRWLRANPRSPGYMLAAATAMLAERAPDAVVDVLADEATAAAARDGGYSLQTVTAADESRLGRLLRDMLSRVHYDEVILLYRDAIGLGWRRVDRAAFAASPTSLLVFNGRQRLMRLDRKRWRALRMRRVLERSWLPELLLVPLVVVVSAALAVVDAIAGSRRDGEVPS